MVFGPSLHMAPIGNWLYEMSGADAAPDTQPAAAANAECVDSLPMTTVSK